MTDTQPPSPCLVPQFLQLLRDPSVRNVMLCGCGGGFDFVHSMTLYPELRRLGKNVVIGSYSFGDPKMISGEAPVVFESDGVVAKRVTAASIPDPYYGPEIHVCDFLDKRYPATAPHFVYAYNARCFTVPALHEFYSDLVREHQIDAVVLFDGGSDSLMVGDEEGLGDPVEDCVSVTTVASLQSVAVKVLVSIGLGCDRFNQVSDAASLRAVAELTAAGGFDGAVALQPTSPEFLFYRDCLDHIYSKQRFQSVIASAIISAGEGHFGADTIPPRVPARVDEGELYMWPLMAVLWAFDVTKVADRSLMSTWIRDAASVRECYEALMDGREQLGDRRRAIENLPRHEEMRGWEESLF